MTDSLITASAIASTLEVHGATWSRWVRSGKAPRPAAERTNLSVYDADVVAEWAAKFAELAAPVEEAA